MSAVQTRRRLMTVMLGAICMLAPAAPAAEPPGSVTNDTGSPPAAALRQRFERSLDRWCRWLATYLYQIPGTDLYTLNPTLGTGVNAYRDVAGNQFAAAAAGYWLKRANPEAATARPLRGLIKLALGTHIAVKAIDRPDIQKWGATLSFADDWHADLFAVAQGMLLRDALPADQQEQLRAILTWEADKQVEYGISKKWRTWPARWPEQSCGESNAWSATLLQMARLAMPGSPRENAWHEGALDYSLNAICLPVDMTSDEVIGGQPLKQRVKDANFEPGGIQEHHGFYHPGYMGWPLAYEAFAYLIDQQFAAERRNPDVYLHNWKFAFDRLKQSTFANGRFIHCAGDDWITYGYGNTQFMPAALFAAAHFKDPDAVRIADQWLALIEHQQDLGKGSVHAARLGIMQRFRINDFAWYEAQEGCCLAQALWLLERMKTADLPAPSTEQQYNQRNVGTYHEPNVRLAWHRDAHRWASIAWRSAFGQWQAIVQPVALPNLLKFNHNGTGIIQISGATRALELEWFNIGTFEAGGFWTVGSGGRESKKVIHGHPPTNKVFPLVRQYQALVVLPEGPSLLIDLCQALDQIWLLRDGSLGLRLAADIFNHNQVTLAASNAPAGSYPEKAWGPHPCADTWHDLQTRSVTIEKLLTIHALAGEGSFQLLQKRQRAPDRSEMVYPDDSFGAEESLLTHELYFGPSAYERPRIVSPGEWFRRTVLVMYCDPAHTPAQPTGTVSGQYPCVVIHLPDIACAIAVNFGDAQSTVESPLGPITVPARSVKVGHAGHRR